MDRPIGPVSTSFSNYLRLTLLLSNSGSTVALPYYSLVAPLALPYSLPYRSLIAPPICSFTPSLLP